MDPKIKQITQDTIKSNLLNIKAGDTVRVYQKIKEGEKERLQTFEGIVIARKHGSEPGATITVRKIIEGIGVEKIFPIHSPLVTKIEIVQKGKVRRAKLYYLRKVKGKRKKVKKMETKSSKEAKEVNLNQDNNSNNS